MTCVMNVPCPSVLDDATTRPSEAPMVRGRAPRPPRLEPRRGRDSSCGPAGGIEQRQAIDVMPTRSHRSNRTGIGPQRLDRSEGSDRIQPRKVRRAGIPASAAPGGARRARLPVDEIGTSRAGIARSARSARGPARDAELRSEGIKRRYPHRGRNPVRPRSGARPTSVHRRCILLMGFPARVASRGTF